MKAVLKNGLIYPQEPVPEDWSDGTELRVKKLRAARSAGPKSRADEWMDAVEAIAAKGDPADDLRLEAAIQAIRRGNKLSRKKAGRIE